MANRQRKSIKSFSYPSIQPGTIMYGSTTVPYWYSDAKGPDGIWLVLLHGLGVDSSVWEPYLEELISRYNVVLLDLPGHGDNRSPFSLDSAAKQVITIMAQRNIGVITVVGHCIGGCVAQAFASTYSEHCRELILIDTFPLGGEQYNYASFKWLSAVSPLMIAVPSPVFSGVLTGLFSAGSTGRHALYPQIRQQKVSPVFKVFKKTMQAMSKLPTPVYYFPVHYLVGSRDHLIPIKKWNQQAAKLHDGTYTVLKGCGHYSVTDDPAGVLTEILRFLP